MRKQGLMTRRKSVVFIDVKDLKIYTGQCTVRKKEHRKVSRINKTFSRYDVTHSC